MVSTGSNELAESTGAGWLGGTREAFEEIFKRNNVRDWLGWSDNDKKFANEERVKELYSWRE